MWLCALLCCQAGTLGDGVPEKGFYTWLMREPQTLVWLPTLHRLIAAETGGCVFSAERCVRLTRWWWFNVRWEYDNVHFHLQYSNVCMWSLKFVFVKLVAKSSVVPQGPSRLRDRWDERSICDVPRSVCVCVHPCLCWFSSSCSSLIWQCRVQRPVISGKCVSGKV